MAASRKSRPLERKDLVRTSAWVERGYMKAQHADTTRRVAVFKQLYIDAKEAVKEVRLRLLKFV